MNTYFGTFGSAHFHPLTGQNLEWAYVEIEADDHDAAQKAMFRAFGDRWANLHREKPALGPVYLLEPFRIALPALASDEKTTTVTLRVRITARAAEESMLTVAGRCIGHRPGLGGMVHIGAGIWFENNVFPDAWTVNRETAALLGAGTIVHARWIPKDLAVRAAASDPENISIIADTESLGVMNRWSVPPTPHDSFDHAEGDIDGADDDDADRREPAPIRMLRTPAEIKKLGDDPMMAFFVEHVLAELERAERVAGWRDSIASIELTRDARGVEVRAVHVSSR